MVSLDLCSIRVTEDVAKKLEVDYLQGSGMRFEVKSNLLVLLPGIPWVPRMWIPWGFGIFLTGKCPDNWDAIKSFIAGEEICRRVVSEEEASTLYNTGEYLEIVSVFLLGVALGPWTPGTPVPWGSVIVLLQKHRDV